MSNSIDNRIVEMEFDNKEFERNIQTSVKSINTLKSSLDFKESSKSLSAFNNVTKSFSLENIGESVEALTSRFSTMGIVGMSVLNRLTDAAINTAKRIADVLVVDHMRSGFREYETQINAVQTILANTSAAMDRLGYDQGQRLDIVNSKLDELNRYADKTIYNFTEMTNNIGRFTAAGVDLETSVTAIQGIANLAAVSGSTSQQASTAMYQLSQALAAGSLKLQDWNSVVNAGMGGKVFQDALVQTATAMGVTVDKTVTTVDASGKKITKTVKKTVKELIEESGSFRESLSTGWITTDVLTETLSHFSWDFEELAKNSKKSDEEITKLRQALIDRGYTLEDANKLLEQSTELTVEQAKNLKKAELIAKGYTSDEADEIIKMAEAATDAATKVKTFTQLFDTLKEAMQSGWTQTWEYIIGDFEEAKELLTSISDYFGSIIEESSASRNELIKGWKDLGGRNSLIEGFWNIISAVKNLSDAIRGEFQKLFPPRTSEQLFQLTERFREFTAKIKAFTENSQSMGKIRRIIAGVANAFDIVRNSVRACISVVKHFAGNFSPYLSDIFEWLAKIGDKITAFNEKLKSEGSYNTFVKNAIETIEKLEEKILSFFSRFSKASNESNEPGFLTKIKTWIESLGGIHGIIQTLLTKVKDIFNAITNFDGNDIVTVLGTLVGGSLVLAIVKFVNGLKRISDTIRSSIKTITKSFESLSEDIGSAFNGDNFKESIFKNILNLAIAIGIISAALFIVSKIDQDRLDDSCIVLGIVAAALVAFSFAISKIPMRGLFKKAASMLLLSATIWIVAGALVDLGTAVTTFADIIEKFGEMDRDKLIQGVVALGAVLLELSLFLLIAKKSDFGAFDGIGMILLAYSMNTFATAISTLGSFDKKTIIQGILGLSAILLELALFLNLTKKVKFGIFKGAAMILLAVSINMFATAIGKIGALNTKEIQNGLIGLGGILLELIIFLNLTKKVKFGVFKGTAMILLATSMILFANAINKIGSLSTDQIIMGITGLGIVLTELIIFLNLTKKVKFGVFKGTAMILLATSMILFANVISKIGNLDTNRVVKGVVGLGAILLEISIFMMLTKKLKFGLGKGLGLILLATSLILFANTIEKIGNISTKNIIKGVFGLGAVLAELLIFMAISKKMKSGITKSVGLVILAIAVNQFAKAISTIGELSLGGVLKGITGLGAVLTELLIFMAISKKAKVGLKNMLGLTVLAVSINMFASAMSKIGTMSFAQITNSLIGIGIILLEMVGFMAILSKVGDGSSIGTAFKSLIVLAAMMLAIQVFVHAMKNLQGIDLQSMIAFSGSFGVAILSFVGAVAIVGKLPIGTVLTGIGYLALIFAAVTALMAVFGAVEEWLNLSKYIDAFGDMMFSIGQAIGKFAGGLVSGIFTGFSAIGTELSNFATNAKPFFDGVKEIDSSTLSGVADLVGIITLIAGANVINAISSWLSGGNAIENFATDIKSLGNALVAYSESVSAISETDQTAIANATTVANGLVELTNSIPAEGGLLQKIEGAKDLGSFAEDIPKFGLALKSYAVAISEFSSVDSASISNSKLLADGLVSTLNSLPEDGGLSQLISGAKDLGGFAKDIPNFGLALSSYAKSIKSFDEISDGANDNALKAANGIVAILNALPSDGGLVTLIAGAKDLGGFAKDIPNFGLALSSYAKSITGLSSVSETDISTALTVATALKDFGDSLPAEGGWLQAIVGQKDLATFGDNCKKVGEGLASFANNIAGVSISDTENATTAMDMIQTFTNSLKDEGGLWTNIGEFFGGKKDIVGLSEKLATFGENFAKFGDGISNASGANDNFEYVKTLIESLNTIAASIENGDIDMDGIYTMAWELGDSFSTILGNAISDGSPDVSNSAESVASDAATAVRGIYSKWVSAGKYLGLGLANGISSMAVAIKNKAISAASGAINAIQVTWAVHSPSKVGEGLGMNFDLGLANGISAYAKQVSGEAVNVGKSAIESAKTMLRGSDMSIFDFIDPNPTIRPVIDMSNVENGARIISGMFSANQIIGNGFFSGRTFSMGAGSLNFEGNRIIGSQDNIDVINELQILRDHIDDLNEAILNMQLVLDSGELVGGTVSKMDASLGNKSMMKNRAN